MQAAIRRFGDLLRRLSAGLGYCPKRYRARCRQSAELINLTRLRPVIAAVGLLEVYFLYSDITKSVPGGMSSASRFLYPDLSLLPVLAVALVLAFLNRPRTPAGVTPFHRVLVRGFALIMMIWCSVVAAAEQNVSGEITTYVIGVLGVSVLLYAGGLFFAVLLLVGLAALVAAASVFGVPPITTLAGHPSLAGMILISWLISRLLYAAHVRQFLARTRLLRARQKLIQAYGRLRSTNGKLRATQVQMIRQEKLASIGHLAAGIAHEMNNPIGFLKSNFSALKQHVSALQPVVTAAAPPTLPLAGGATTVGRVLSDIEELFRDTDEGFQRIIRVVRNLLDFSRVQSSRIPEQYDLHAGIESTLIVARAEYRDIAEIVREYGDIPPIRCHGGEINQVLLNILTNAAQAIRSAGPEPKGVIRIRTWAEGDTVQCAISNNGPPIPPEVRERIFDPFFTTKPSGSGTGLGLSIAFDIIVNGHGGKLEVSSGELTTFQISLPTDYRR